MINNNSNNSLFGLNATASEELVICSIVVVVTSVQPVVGKIALVFILAYSFHSLMPILDN